MKSMLLPPLADALVFSAVVKLLFPLEGIPGVFAICHINIYLLSGPIYHETTL